MKNMKFQDLKIYFQERNYDVEIDVDDTGMTRRFLFSKENIAGRFYESDWLKLSAEEQMNLIIEKTTHIEELVQYKLANKEIGMRKTKQ